MILSLISHVRYWNNIRIHCIPRSRALSRKAYKSILKAEVSKTVAISRRYVSILDKHPCTIVNDKKDLRDTARPFAVSKRREGVESNICQFKVGRIALGLFSIVYRFFFPDSGPRFRSRALLFPILLARFYTQRGS